MSKLRPAMLTGSKISSGPSGFQRSDTGVIVPAGSVATAKQSGGGATWPDAFMSYTPSSPIVLDGVSNQTIEYLSFDGNCTRANGNPRPITLYNCNNITIRRIDSRRNTMGLLFALECTNLTIEYIRVENIGYEFIGGFPGNNNDLNLYQLDKCYGFEIHDIKGRYGTTEDVLSHYQSGDGEVYNVQFEGARFRNQPTSDGAQSVPWVSGSGTGCILGDNAVPDSAYNVYVHDCTFLNAGQVGLQCTGGHNVGYDNCVSMADGNTVDGGILNNAATIYDHYGTGTCYDNYFTNLRTWYANGAHYWTAGDCGVVDTTGSVFGDGTLDVDDYRVTL